MRELPHQGYLVEGSTSEAELAIWRVSALFALFIGLIVMLKLVSLLVVSFLRHFLQNCDQRSFIVVVLFGFRPRCAVPSEAGSMLRLRLKTLSRREAAVLALKMWWSLSHQLESHVVDILLLVVASSYVGFCVVLRGQSLLSLADHVRR